MRSHDPDQPDVGRGLPERRLRATTPVHHHDCCWLVAFQVEKGVGHIVDLIEEQIHSSSIQLSKPRLGTYKYTYVSKFCEAFSFKTIEMPVYR